MRCGRPPTRRLVQRMNTETPAVPCEDVRPCLTRGGQWRLRVWEAPSRERPPGGLRAPPGRGL
eukprot:2871475-Lingulodinium_polyedra.AAC.1